MKHLHSHGLGNGTGLGNRSNNHNHHHHHHKPAGAKTIQNALSRVNNYTYKQPISEYSKVRIFRFHDLTITSLTEVMLPAERTSFTQRAEEDLKVQSLLGRILSNRVTVKDQKLSQLPVISNQLAKREQFQGLSTDRNTTTRSLQD